MMSSEKTSNDSIKKKEETGQNIQEQQTEEPIADFKKGSTYQTQMKARVRKARALDSDLVQDLDIGTVVVVQELIGRRALISKPVQGWLSFMTANKEMVLSKVDDRRQRIGETILTKNPTDLWVPGQILDFSDKLSLFHVKFLLDTTEHWIGCEEGVNTVFLGETTANLLEIARKCPVNLLDQLHPKLKQFLNPEGNDPKRVDYLSDTVRSMLTPKRPGDRDEKPPREQTQYSGYAQDSEKEANFRQHMKKDPSFYDYNRGGDYQKRYENDTRQNKIYEQLMAHRHERENQRRLYESYLQKKRLEYNKLLGERPIPRSTFRPHKSSGEKLFIIIRGFPGSGKTTLARQITELFGGQNLICSEDRYHWTGGSVGVGQFHFKAEINWQTRDWCAREVVDALKEGRPLIIVDNINYRIIHYEEHVRTAKGLGYTCKILEIIHNAELIPKFRARCKLNLAQEEWIRLGMKWEKDPRAQLLYPTFIKKRSKERHHYSKQKSDRLEAERYSYGRPERTERPERPTDYRGMKPEDYGRQGLEMEMGRKLNMADLEFSRNSIPDYHGRELKTSHNEFVPSRSGGKLPTDKPKHEDGSWNQRIPRRETHEFSEMRMRDKGVYRGQNDIIDTHWKNEYSNEIRIPGPDDTRE